MVNARGKLSLKRSARSTLEAAVYGDGNASGVRRPTGRGRGGSFG